MDGCWIGEAEDEGETESKHWKTKSSLYEMDVFTLLTWEMYRDYISVRNRIKSAETVLVCSHIVFPLHPSLQSWTAQSQATSRTASGRYCPAGRTVTASRLLSHIAVTLATTCWAPAPSPVKGTVPGIAPCPSVCVSISGTSCKWCFFFFIAQMHHLHHL